MELKLLQDGIQFEHSRAVSKIRGLLAKQMGYPPDEIAIIEQVALYHDLGYPEDRIIPMEKLGA